jgi:hypothetical protein
MVLRVSDPVLARELLAFLESRSDAIAVVVGEDEVEIPPSGASTTGSCPWSSPGVFTSARHDGVRRCPWRA